MGDAVSSGNAERRHVAIGTPAYSNHVTTPYVRALLKSMNTIAQAGHSVSWLCHGNVAAVPRIRNRIVQEALDLEVTDLVFIDGDIAWGDDMLVRLLAWDTPIVGAVMPTTTSTFGKKKYPFRSLTQGYLQVQDGLVEVEGLPTAFLRIRRDALKVLADAVDKVVIGSNEEQMVVPRLFDYSVQPFHEGRTNTHAGEDFTFCVLARNYGFKVMLDPYIKLGHMKDVIVEGALADELAEAPEPPAQDAG